MFQLRVPPSVHRRQSIRLASQLSQSPAHGIFSAALASAATKSGHKPSSILSRLSDRVKSGVHGNSNTDHKNSGATEHKKSRAISFVSPRSAQKRDDAAERWHTDVRQFTVDNVTVGQSDAPKSSLNKKRVRSGHSKQHAMRPGTDLDTLFAQPSASVAISTRVQAKKELGGDYSAYLPDGYVDPYRLPVEYARLVLGRNKHISLDAQTGALNIVEEAIHRKTARQLA